MSIVIELHRQELPLEIKQAIMTPLDDFTRDQGHVWSPTTFSLVLVDSAGQVQGGLFGEILWEWLRVSILSVTESFRGQGLGRRLMMEAEQVARDAGCHSAWVDTFSFQAPEFYPKLGYVEFARLADFPRGASRIFFRKSLIGELSQKDAAE